MRRRGVAADDDSDVRARPAQIPPRRRHRTAPDAADACRGAAAGGVCLCTHIAHDARAPAHPARAQKRRPDGRPRARGLRHRARHGAAGSALPFVPAVCAGGSARTGAYDGAGLRPVRGHPAAGTRTAVPVPAVCVRHGRAAAGVFRAARTADLPLGRRGALHPAAGAARAGDVSRHRDRRLPAWARPADALHGHQRTRRHARRGARVGAAAAVRTGRISLCSVFQ